ncbi:MAG TPA: hypothetical protein VK497_04990 [Candidatus Saccharimonadales bacterium]|nr:hypothetical protein [Candidatus Saccharimonadales bacterium]
MTERLNDRYDEYEQLLEVERGELEQYFASTVKSRMGGGIRVDTLFKRTATSPYGQHIRQQPLRFPRQEYDRETKLRHLGMDVDPLLHQLQLGVFLAQILETERITKGELPITEEEVGILMLAAMIHDMGEVTHETIEQEVGAVVGDIPFGNKTDADRDVEAQVRIALYLRLFPDVSIEVLQRVEKIISHGEESVLHDLFEAAHTFQSYNTATVADQTLEREPETIYRPQLEHLRDNVRDSSINELLKWAKKFTFINDFVDYYEISSESSDKMIEKQTVKL